jgi:hypothetical protein
MAWSTTSMRAGLRTNAAAPSMATISGRSGSSSELMTITGAVAARVVARIFCIASSPFPPGRRTSSTMSCGTERRATMTAWSAS